MTKKQKIIGLVALPMMVYYHWLYFVNLWVYDTSWIPRILFSFAGIISILWTSLVIIALFEVKIGSKEFYRYGLFLLVYIPFVYFLLRGDQSFIAQMAIMAGMSATHFNYCVYKESKNLIK